MGLEKRGNNFYFYEKTRIGNRVVSRYSGGGKLAGLMHLLDQQRQEEARLEKEAKRKSTDAERQKLAEIDQVIDQIQDQTDTLADALFLINGYHKHSRSWRRKRNG